MESSRTRVLQPSRLIVQFPLLRNKHNVRRDTTDLWATEVEPSSPLVSIYTTIDESPFYCPPTKKSYRSVTVAIICML